MTKSSVNSSSSQDDEKLLGKMGRRWRRLNKTTAMMLFVAVIIFFGIVLFYYFTEELSTEVVVDLFAGALGLILGLVWNRVVGKDEKENEKKVLIADFYEHLYGGMSDKEYILAPHLKKNKNLGTAAKLIERNAKASLDRWNESFERVCSLPGFNNAWDIFWVLRKDIQETVEGASDLALSLSGEQSSTSVDRTGLHIKDIECSHLKTALRNLESGLLRRDEAYIEIPSLQTLLSTPKQDSGISSDISNRLSAFWPLFGIASSDLRLAFLRLTKLTEKHGITSAEVKLINRTLLAALERIRNCIAILKNGQTMQDPAQGDPAGKGSSKPVRAYQIGNTVISNEDRKRLVKYAKELEGGHTLNVDERGNMEDIYGNILPANFGVMIRDIDTACVALERIAGVAEKADRN